MIIKIQKIKNVNVVEGMFVGTFMSITTAAINDVYDGWRKNSDRLKMWGLLLVGLYIIATIYCIKKLNDNGELKKKLGLPPGVQPEFSKNKTKNTLLENKQRIDNPKKAKPRKDKQEDKPQKKQKNLLDLPPKAMQLQFKKPKPKASLLFRFRTAVKDFLNTNNKNTSSYEEPLADNAIESEVEVISKVKPSKPKKQRNRHRGHNIETVALKLPESKNEIVEEDDELKKQSNESNTSFFISQADDLPLSESNDDIAVESEGEQEEKEVFSSTAVSDLTLSQDKSDNNAENENKESHLTPVVPTNAISPKASFSSSTMQILALTPRGNPSEHISDSQNESKQLCFSSATISQLSQPESPKVESPSSQSMLSSERLTPVIAQVNDEKNSAIVESLANQVAELALQKLQTMHQTKTTTVDESTLSSTATPLIEEMKALIAIAKQQSPRLQQPNMFEEQKHSEEKINQVDTTKLTHVLQNLLIQSKHLATLSALQDPLHTHRREKNGVYTAVDHFQGLCIEFINACKLLGLDMSSINLHDPAFLPTRKL